MASGAKLLKTLRKTFLIKGAIAADTMAFAIVGPGRRMRPKAGSVRRVFSRKHALFAGYFCLNEHQLAPIPGPAGIDYPQRHSAPNLVRRKRARLQPVRRCVPRARAAGGLRAGAAGCAV